MSAAEEKTILIMVMKVRSEAGDSFTAWRETFNHAVTSFAGFVSLEMQPSQKKDYVEWTGVQRFRTADSLNAWRQSKVRLSLLEKAKPFLVEAIQELESKDYQGNKSVTEVFVTRVSPEKYEAYREWASKIQQVESQFPGYQGIYIQAPEKEKTGTWITILRFDTPEHLDAWINSSQRKEILKESASIVEELQSHRVVSPFTGWFANLSKEAGESPAVWKQTMLVLLVLFPMVMLELRFLSPLTAHLNPSLATFIGNAISVTLISWPMLPLAIWFLKWWLAPGTIHRRRKTLTGFFVVSALYLLEIGALWRLL